MHAIIRYIKNNFTKHPIKLFTRSVDQSMEINIIHTIIHDIKTNTSSTRKQFVEFNNQLSVDEIGT